MITPVTPASWMSHLIVHDSSLNYIGQNGSLIRFVEVSDDVSHLALKQVLNDTHKEQNVALFSASSHLCNLNRPDLVLHLLCQRFPLRNYLVAVCKQVWRDIGFVSDDSVLLADAFRVLGGEPNGLLRKFVKQLRDLTGRSLATTNMDEGARFSRDFSNALINCCTSLTDGDYSQIRVFESWLCGGPSTAAERRPLGIMSPVKRETATANLKSLLCLMFISGWTGSILHLDIRSLTDQKSFSDIPSSNVSKTKRIGTYQWLRELIDQVQFFTGTLIVVEVAPGFVDQSPTGKGVGLYDALKNRIIDDVIVDGPANRSAVSVPLSENQIHVI
jgi:hypothetical protein